MRTTITLDPDVAALVEAAMRERGESFKEAVNGALRKALAGKKQTFHTAEHDMGQPSVPLTHALQLAAELEDDELRRKLSVGK